MKPFHKPAFMSVLAVATLLLFSAFFTNLAFGLSSYFEQSKARNNRIKADDALNATMLSLLEAVQTKFDNKTLTITSFLEAQALQEGTSASFTDHSARINLNWMNKFFFENTELKTLFTFGSADALQQMRFKDGPFSTLEPFAAYFDKKVLEEFFTVSGPINLNTADEFMLEKVAGIRMGSESYGSRLREQARSWRLSQIQAGKPELDTFFGSDAAKARNLFSIEPDLNVNTAKEQVLSLILVASVWKIENPQSRIQVLLEKRKQGIVKKSDLQAVLGLPKEHVLYGYLGDRSNVAEIVLTKGATTRRCLFFIDYNETADSEGLRLHIMGMD